MITARTRGSHRRLPRVGPFHSALRPRATILCPTEQFSARRSSFVRRLQPPLVSSSRIFRRRWSAEKSDFRSPAPVSVRLPNELRRAPNSSVGLRTVAVGLSRSVSLPERVNLLIRVDLFLRRRGSKNDVSAYFRIFRVVTIICLTNQIKNDCVK